MSQTVFVGLSGGVDSGTSAAILKERGYDVVGVFIKIWQPEFIECTWREDRLDALRIAASLGIPFREIDLSQEYKQEVVDSMVRDYERGITPNPDVLCNEKIKFGAFARWAFANGADLIATGHYARAEYTSQTCAEHKSDLCRPHLLRGADTNKDQSYFLYRIRGEDLARTLFPIGNLSKPQVRERARSFGLPVAQKPDSQGLCFVGDVTMRDFLARFITLKPGSVLDTNGKVIGAHEGASLYTIGQRHGFTTNTASTHNEVHYVISISIKDNSITVSPDRTLAEVCEITLRDTHWIGDTPVFPLKTLAQSRYRETPFPVTIEQSHREIIARFDEPHLVSSGQSLVLYDDTRTLGGGIIKRNT